MYKCQICNTVVQASTTAQRITLETRLKTYPARAKLYPPKRLDPRQARRLLLKYPERDHEDFKHWTDDPGGHGLEIVRETLVCPSCAARALKF